MYFEFELDNAGIGLLGKIQLIKPHPNPNQKIIRRLSFIVVVVVACIELRLHIFFFAWYSFRVIHCQISGQEQLQRRWRRRPLHPASWSNVPTNPKRFPKPYTALLQSLSATNGVDRQNLKSRAATAADANC